MQVDVIRILLVEDNPADARLVEWALSEVVGCRFDVIRAERLSEALQCLDGPRFDAILLDLSLPDSFGLDTISQIGIVAPTVPIVVLSGLLDDELAFEAVKGGAQDYLVKGQGDGYLIARSVRYAMERKRAEEALRESERMLEQAQRIAHVGHWVWDIASGHLSWSDEVYRIYGYQPQAFTPTYELFLAAVAVEDRQRMVDSIDASLRGRGPLTFEHGIVRTDGTLRTVEERGEMDFNAAGNPVRMRGTVQDVTTFKEVETELRRARDDLELRVEVRTAHLAEANRRLEHEVVQRTRTEEILRGERDFIAAVLDTVGALVVVLDGKGRIIRSNRACEQTTGYPFEEVRGKPVWEVFVAPDERRGVKQIFNQLLNVRSPSEYQNYWVTRSGERRMIAWSNTVLPARNGAAAHVIATGIDITDQRKAEEHERQRMLELAHVGRLSTMGEMATEIAHELNQPLTAIASYSDTCNRIMKLPTWNVDEVHEILGEISGQAHRAGEIIRRLRSFARKEDSQRASVDVNELVKDMVYLTEAEARWHDVTVLLELADRLPSVVADRILIEQVMINLVRNAIDVLGSDQSVQKRVLVQTWVNDRNMVEVAVSDTGPGLSADAVKRVFEPFYTTKSSGMGMGLSISQSIIESHDGELWVTSQPGQGATFGFVLPLETEVEVSNAV